MKQPPIILTILFLVFSATQVKADIWFDPTWKQMITKSDVIALVEYTTQGDFHAMAKPLTVYKGKLTTKEIRISGFSNQYGPINKMNPGDRYIVFLTHYKPTAEDLAYWEEEAKREPAQLEFYEALKAGKAYYVWTPTSGFLKVTGEKVQYDLLQISYSQQPYYPLAEFETFLKACSEAKKAAFYKQTLKKVQKSATDKRCAQYLMMLYLTSYRSFNPVYQQIADANIPESCIALAKLLGQTKGDKSRDLLVQLLDNENSLVQGAAVSQLANEAPEFIGPILLAKLESAGEGGLFPIMDPIMNQMEVGTLEIIKTLGKLKYKPAAKVLAPLLEIEDLELFRLVIGALLKLKSKAFIPYLNKHLKKKTFSLIDEICKIVVDNNLEECKPALMDFITTHNRNGNFGYDYVSTHTGLGHFDDDETRDFLLKDFENLLTNNDSIENYPLKRWIESYIEVFADLKVEKARPLIYTSLHKWFGINQDFVLYPELLTLKKSIEASTHQKTLQLLEDVKVYEIRSRAIIHNTAEFGENFVPEYDIFMFIELNESLLNTYDARMKKLLEVRAKVSKHLNIPEKQITLNNYLTFTDSNNTLETDMVYTPLDEFYEYAKALPNKKDLQLLEIFADAGFITRYDNKKDLEETMKQIADKLKE